MDPMISAASATRFLFGTDAMVEGEPTFYGAVVFGTNLTYDGTSGLPTGGEIDRIELQTRSGLGPHETHGVYSDFNATVADLNAAFTDATKPWFDPSQFFDMNLMQADREIDWAGDDGNDVLTGTNTGEDAFVADMTGAAPGNVMARDFKAADDNLYLETGDVLTGAELFAIFTAGATHTGKHLVYDQGDGNLMALLQTNLNEINEDSFYDVDTESPEGDALLGAL